MQLLNGTLRYPLLHTGKCCAKSLLNTKQPAASGKWFSALDAQRRHYANVPAIAMSYEKFDAPKGDANQSPVITMHGLFGSKQNWRSISRALAARTNRRIFTVDARNHGDSPHADTHNSEGMTADFVAFLQSQSITKANLLGHSMGGRSVMHFALSYPQLVERLIVVDISPVSIPKTLGEMSNIFDAMISVSVPAELPLSTGRQQAKSQMLKSVHKDSVDFILLNLRKKPNTGEFYWACNVEVLRRSLSGFQDYRSKIAHLAPFTGPTTFLCGTHSSYMNYDEWPQILEIFPNATLHWLDTGHLVHLEEPHKFIEITSQFLNA